MWREGERKGRKGEGCVLLIGGWRVFWMFIFDVDNLLFMTYLLCVHNVCSRQ